MKIPIRNLYYLLCYAWDALDLKDLVDVGTEDSPESRDLLARMLVVGCSQLLRRGLDREYLPHAEETALIRGWKEFSESIRRLSLRRQKLCVEYDELHPDTQANRVIKAAVKTMLSVQDLPQQLREELAATYRALGGVSDIALNIGAIRRVHLHRNNRYYRLMMDVSEMIYESVIPIERGEGARFHDLVRDEVRMRKLFQRFVYNLFAREQDEYVVSAPAFGWKEMVTVRPGQVSLPRMETDVVLTGQDQCLIIETKFTPKMVTGKHGSTTLQSDHVYQLFAYLQNLPAAKVEDRKVVGILLYPTVDESDLDLEWRLGNITFRAASLNLAAEWKSIKDSLLGLVSTCHKPLSYRQAR